MLALSIHYAVIFHRHIILSAVAVVSQYVQSELRLAATVLIYCVTGTMDINVENFSSICVCVCVCVCALMYMCVCVCACMCVRVRVCVYMCICVYVCAYMCMCVCVVCYTSRLRSYGT